MFQILQIFDNEAKDLDREVCFIDIACDEIPERYYKESEVGERVCVLGPISTALNCARNPLKQPGSFGIQILLLQGSLEFSSLPI